MCAEENSQVAIKPENMCIILATDCGSTTTKARLFMKSGNEYRYVVSGEAPTTVEAPYEDVRLGVRNAIREIEELTGLKFLDEGGIKVRNSTKEEGADLYLTTSSAGGGLQMTVIGVMRGMTAESGERAALGGGAVVLDVLARDDKRPPHVKISRLRQLRPDMVLMAGGTDGGDIQYVTELAELLSTADPKARVGVGFKLPGVYAGNSRAQPNINRILGDKFELKMVENIRPKMEEENSQPAREAIQLVFMEHVMSHAPGYDKLMKWTDVPIMPTPMAEGTMMTTLARLREVNLVGVGLGGATTNVYSVFDGRFVRTVSANLGMSYSICNVLKEAGIRNIFRWLPFDIDEDRLDDILGNKMIRPTTIPETMDELMVEQAVAREALRLGLEHHKLLARGLRGMTQQRTVGRLFEQTLDSASYVDMMRVSIICGTGGLLSHAPERSQSALILIDGFQPEGVTALVQDSVFMIPHLGVLSTVYSEAALEIFEKDCLVRLGTCVAPRGAVQEGEELVKVEGTLPNGDVVRESCIQGELKTIPLGIGQEIDLSIKPARNCDVGEGPGRTKVATVEGGLVGVIIDARGRPLTLPDDDKERKRKLVEWYSVLRMYTTDTMEKYQRERVG